MLSQTKLMSPLILARAVGKKEAKYLNSISSNTRIIHILVNTPTKVKLFLGSEGVKCGPLTK
jgi:hypothetical protein